MRHLAYLLLLVTTLSPAQIVTSTVVWINGKPQKVAQIGANPPAQTGFVNCVWRNSGVVWSCEVPVVAGPPGKDGTNGINGKDGLPGKDGVNGTNGKDGINGTNGKDGMAATIAVGTTVTGLPGTPARVTNVGTVNAAVLNFVIPAGKPGADGKTGPTGPAGPPAQLPPDPNFWGFQSKVAPAVVACIPPPGSTDIWYCQGVGPNGPYCLRSDGKPC